MVEAHDVKLEKISKTEASRPNDPKEYNRSKCPFCGRMHSATHDCLMHVLRDHRLALFCSVQKGAQCSIVISLVSLQGREYTISVRVKPKVPAS